MPLAQLAQPAGRANAVLPVRVDYKGRLVFRAYLGPLALPVQPAQPAQPARPVVRDQKDLAARPVQQAQAAQ